MLLVTKILTQLAFPLFQGLSLILLGWLLLTLGRRRLSHLCLLLGVAIIWVFSTPAVSNALRSSLELRYLPMAIAATPKADVIVILGGALAYPVPPRLETELTNESDRVLHAARLYHAGKAPHILASGGTMPWSQAGSEAAIIRDLLLEWGVPAEAILLETESRTTRENALYTRELLAERNLSQVLLVTSAMHMPRSVATFAALDIAVIPTPTDITVTTQLDGTLLDWLPSSGSLDASSRAIKEYLGMWVYWLRGW